MRGSFLKKLRVVSIGSAMADMALLLLVFFMATTTTEPPKGVAVDLPSGKTKGAEQDSIYLTISSNQQIYIDSNLVSISELSDQLAMRHTEKDRVVAITADKDLHYRTVSGVLEVLKNQDFLNIVFMAQPNIETGN